MNSITTILEFGGSHHCFLSIVQTPISSEWRTQKSSNLRDHELQVYETENDQGTKIYFSIQSKLSDISSGDTVQISGLYGAKLQLKDGDPLVLKHIKSAVQTAKRVSVDPVCADDWEILEQNAGRVEAVLLDQVRVVWPGQVLPLWIQKQLVVYMKITSLEPMSGCAILENNTEIVVAIKTRASLPPRTLSLPTKRSMVSPPGQSLQSPQFLGSPQKQSESPCKLKSNLNDFTDTRDTLEPKKTGRSPNRSQRKSIQVPKQKSKSAPGFEETTKRPFVRRQSSLMESVLSYIFPFYDKKDSDSNSNSDAGSAIDFSIQSLPSRNAVMRVQPMQIKHSLEDCMMTRSKQLAGKDPLPQSLFAPRNVWQAKAEECDVPAELFQASTVYVDAGVFKTERLLHPHLPFLPPVVIARISKLPSPLEKVQAEQRLKKKNAGKEEVGKTEGEKGKEDGDLDLNNFKGSCYVRVVGVYRQAILAEDPWNEAADKLLSEQALMWGHVIVPDLLRRQLRLDATSSVWLQTGTVDIVIPRKICVYPITTVPQRYTNDMLAAAFIAHIKLIADKDHPLVVYQGLPVKFIAFPGSSIEAQITFYGELDNLSPGGVTMLSEMNIESVLVVIQRNHSEDKLGVVNDSLSLSKVQDIDPKPPTVRLKTLGGFNSLAKQAISHLHSSLCNRPFSRSSFAARAGLSHGILLITGPRGSGKTSLATAICRKMFQSPVMAHVQIIDCKTLRGKTVTNIQKILEQMFDEAAWREPAIIMFDNLDVIMPAPSGPDGDISGEALYAARNAQGLQGLMNYEIENNSHIAIIATATSRSSLHQTLVSSRGDHMVQSVINIGSPDKDSREHILRAILQNHNCISTETLKLLNLKPVAAKTEAFVARDLEGLVNRALHTRLIGNKDALQQKITLTSEEFETALCSYKPVSIRNVDLHKAGELGWEDVGGLEDVKTSLIETLRWPTKYPQLFSSCPLRLRSGVLLYGAPGTGKTLLAGVVAKECGLNFISIKGPELLSKYIGASEQAVRDLFMRAQSAKPCILFFDEFDSIAPKRGHDSTGVTDRVVNQLLTQLDGVEGLQGVYVLGATSRPDLLDPALLRPGRLDKSLFCCMPGKRERVSILESLTRKMTMAADVNLASVANMCEHFTGADLKALLYNAQLEAIHEQANTKATLRSGVIRIKGDDTKSDLVKRASVILDDPKFEDIITKAVEKATTPPGSQNTSLDETSTPRDTKPGRRRHRAENKQGSHQDSVIPQGDCVQISEDRLKELTEKKVKIFKPGKTDYEGEDCIDGMFLEKLDLNQFNGSEELQENNGDYVDGPTPDSTLSNSEIIQKVSSGKRQFERQNEFDIHDSNSDKSYVEEYITKQMVPQTSKEAVAINITESSSPDEPLLHEYPDPSKTYPPVTAKRKRAAGRANSQPPESNSLTVVKQNMYKSPSIDKPVSVFPSLSQGLKALSPEDEAKYLSMVKEIQRRNDRLFDGASDKRRSSLQLTARQSHLLEVTQSHLVKAAQTMRPSVSSTERLKYTHIYENFMSSRTGQFTKQSEVQVGKRATLA